MKQHDVKKERVLGGNKFYVRPFAAFVATRVSGEVMPIAAPVISAILPLVMKAEQDGDEINIYDTDIEEAIPLFIKAMSGLSGEKLESTLKKLLVNYGNISVERDCEEDDGGARSNSGDIERLTEDLANEVFCGDVQDMFILAFDVIMANFSGFFKRLSGQFGKQLEEQKTKA